MSTIVLSFLIVSVVGLLLGLVAARFRCLTASIIASASIGFFPSALLWMEYHGPNSVLSVTFISLVSAIPHAVVSIGFALLGYFLLGRPLRKQEKYPNRHLNILLVVIATLIIPVYIGVSFIPPLKTSQSNYYEMLIEEQLDKVGDVFDGVEYELVFEDRNLYIHVKNDEEGGDFIWLDIYDEIGAGFMPGYSLQPVLIFPRTEDWMLFPDIRGAFLHDDTLYYNFGVDKTVAKSAINSRLSQQYFIRDFNYAKIDLATMQSTSIDKSEYERTYTQVKKELSP